jgi:hypothetical protein
MQLGRPKWKRLKYFMPKFKPVSLEVKNKQREDRKTYKIIRRKNLKNLIVPLMMSDAMLGK